MGMHSSYYKNQLTSLKIQSGVYPSHQTSIYGNLLITSKFSAFDQLKLPLRISGRLISVGMYRENPYGFVAMKEEVLKETTPSWNGLKIFKSHMKRDESTSVDEVIGKFIETTWNEKDPGVDFVAEIYDWNLAYKIMNGVVNRISGVFARNVVKNGGQWYYTNIEPIEAGLVEDGRDQKAIFSPI